MFLPPKMARFFSSELFSALFELLSTNRSRYLSIAPFATLFSKRSQNAHWLSSQAKKIFWSGSLKSWHFSMDVLHYTLSSSSSFLKGGLTTYSPLFSMCPCQFRSVCRIQCRNVSSANGPLVENEMEWIALASSYVQSRNRSKIFPLLLLLLLELSC